MAFNLMFGVGAIFSGRWIFENPTKVAPVWLFKNPSNPSLKACFRAYGLCFIFVGSFMIIGGFIKLILPESVGWIVALISAIVSTWFLRPRAPERT
jgi:hypothetical protein